MIVHTRSGRQVEEVRLGTGYPRTLPGAVIARIRAEKAVTGAQAAICRACLARDHRLGFEREDAPVSLDRDETHPAYRLGRLFAVCERVQRAALGTVNASIRDRYFGAASSTPATVFPLLARRCANHVTSLRRREKSRGLAHWYELEIDAILDGIGTAFPRSLRLEDQGVSGCVEPRINGAQRRKFVAITGTDDDSERWVGSFRRRVGRFRNDG